MPTREQVFDNARFAKAAFWGASEMVLKMHKMGLLDAERALAMIREAYDASQLPVHEAEKLLKQLTEEMLKHDLPPV